MYFKMFFRRKFITTKFTQPVLLLSVFVILSHFFLCSFHFNMFVTNLTFGVDVPLVHEVSNMTS